MIIKIKKYCYVITQYIEFDTHTTYKNKKEKYCIINVNNLVGPSLYKTKKKI